jgi:RES domain-containing protein
VRLYRFGTDPFRSPDQEFNGRGGVLYAGRWHFKGTPCVYASLSQSLALLEVLVHRRPKEPTAYPLYVAEVPERFLQVLHPTAYPEFWRSLYPSPSTQRLGTGWLKSKGAVGLIVPSVILPGQYNCLLNPESPDYPHVTVEGPLMTLVDPRLLYPGTP